jgi:hypothetical protein
MSQLTPLVLTSLGSVSSSNNVSSNSSAMAPNGDIYVCGTFLGTLDIGGSVPPITGNKELSGFIAKYTKNLAPLALVGLISNEEAICVSLAIANNGDVYVCGNFQGTLDIGGDVPLINVEKRGAYIAKYNNNLSPLALVGLISNDTAACASLAIANNGNVYVCGTFTGTLDIGGSVPPIITNSKEGDGFIAKYNNSLRPLALVGLVSKNPADASLFTNLAIDNNGNIYVCGDFTGTLDIGGSVPSITNINIEKGGGFIAKYTNSLRPLALIGLISNDTAACLSLAIANNGDVYVCGAFTGTLDIGGSVPPIITNSKEGDGFIAKYNNSLRPLALKGSVSKNPADASLFTTLAIDNNGNIYVYGIFTGTLNVGDGIPPITNTSRLSPFGGFLLVLNSNLKSISLNYILNYVQVFGVDITIYPSNNIIIDYSSGELILTGSFLSNTDIGGGVPPITLSSDTLIGGFLAKYLTTIEPICLVADTPIRTDQGLVLIQNIDKAIHTIGGKRIVAITKAITPEKHLICFEQHSMAINLPNRRTVMTPGHEVLYKGKLVQAKHFVGKIDGVHTVPYDGKVVYNVLLETHGLMSVNNMTVETLHPENKVAKMILKSL